MQTQDQAAARVVVAQQAIAEAAANGSNASARSINSFISSLTRAADTAGKTQSQLLEMKAAQLGVSDAAASSIAALRAFEQQSSAAGEAAEGFGVKSAGARLEIVRLIHEASTGNWGNFAGSAQVLGEKVDIMGKLMSPAGIAIGLASAAVVGFAYEAIKGASSFDALGKSAQVTNGYIGLTSSNLEDMSKNIAGSGQSITDVQAAMTALVSSGQVAADQLALATKVTAEFASDTGKSADQAAQAMISFAQDPQKALQDLQTQYHTFTAAQVDVIENYIKTGDSADAYKAILQGMDDAHTKFKDSATQNIGIVQSAWLGLKSIVVDTINRINGIGVAATDTEKLAAAMQRVDEAQANVAKTASMPGSFGAQAAQKGLSAAQAALSDTMRQISDSQRAADQQASIAAAGDGEVASNKYLNSTDYATPLQQRNLAIEKENAAYAVAIAGVDKNSTIFNQDEARHAADLAQIEKQYQNAIGTKSIDTAGLQQQADAVKQALSQINTEYTNSVAILDAAHKAGAVSDADYYDQLRADIAKAESAREGQLEGEIAALKQHQASGAEQIRINKQIQDAETQLANARADSSTLSQKSWQAEDAAMVQRMESVVKYTDGLKQQLATMQNSADLQVSSVGMGTLESQQASQLNSVMRQYDQQRTTLLGQRSQATSPDDKAMYDNQLTALQAAQDKAVSITQDGFDRMKVAQGNWENGATQAYQNLADQSANVAGQVSSAFTDAFNGMADAFATFVTTGKLSFTSLATSVISDIARMAARAAESQLFGAALSALGIGTSSAATSFSGAFHLAAGGAVYGPGSSTSDSIPAMLSAGEYVLPASAVQRVGVPALDALRGGSAHGMLRFALGGYVGSGAAAATSGGAGDIHIDAPVSVQGGPSAAANQSGGAELQKKLDQMLKAFLQNERKQGGTLWKMQNGIA
ncbi:phage tail tape measure protein [Paraburkholderia sp. BCC1885]|uniref:phage tail tape measure protein n=1 Tax=Paraburkholderia sp. BCC1885 TaxID=2562669 RepID=UPI001181E5BB|nr:phage tail tape measure protein [Paraburkholderia sp. BCC1885]